MAIQPINVIIETEVTNPMPVAVKYAWGNESGVKLLVPAGGTIRVPGDVFTKSDNPSRQNLTSDLAHGRVRLKYITHGVDCVREDGEKVMAQPSLPMPEPAKTISDVKAAEQPKPQTMDEREIGASKNTALADEYDAIGRTGSIESAKPERVSPLDDQPATRDASEQISLDDWDGTLAGEQAAVKEIAPPQTLEEIPEEARQVAALREEKQARKEGFKAKGKKTGGKV